MENNVSKIGCGLLIVLIAFFETVARAVCLATFLLLMSVSAHACERPPLSSHQWNEEPPKMQCVAESGRACERPPIRVELREGTATAIETSPPTVLCVLDRETFNYTVKRAGADLRYMITGMAPHGGTMFSTPSKDPAPAQLQLCLVTWGKTAHIDIQFAIRISGLTTRSEACTGRTGFVGVEWSSVLEEASRGPDRYLVQMRVRTE